jgi:hypothetical protein
MKELKSILWGAAAGVAVCGATGWMGTRGAGPLGPNSAIAQQDTSNRPTPQEQRQLMQDVRIYSMTPEALDSVRSSEREAWAACLSFLQANAPNRYSIISRDQLRPGAPLRIQLVRRWQNMEQVRSSQPQLYESMVQQFTSEDHLIGLAAKLRLANRNRLPSVGQLQNDIHTEAMKLEDLILAERNLRLVNQQRLLAMQQAELQRDTKNKGQLADARATAIITRSLGRGGGEAVMDPPAGGQNPPDALPGDVTQP